MTASRALATEPDDGGYMELIKRVCLSARPKAAQVAVA